MRPQFLPLLLAPIILIALNFTSFGTTVDKDIRIKTADSLVMSPSHWNVIYSKCSQQASTLNTTGCPTIESYSLNNPQANTQNYSFPYALNGFPFTAAVSGTINISQAPEPCFAGTDECVAPQPTVFSERFFGISYLWMTINIALMLALLIVSLRLIFKPVVKV